VPAALGEQASEPLVSLSPLLLLLLLLLLLSE
jgi:hypothetical protein